MNTKENENGWTALHYAAGIRKCIEVTKMLFNAGANVTAIDNNGRTALHLAIEKRSTKSWWNADDIDNSERLLINTLNCWCY